MHTLPEDIHVHIVRHAKHGDALLEQGRVKDAITEYGIALSLVPEPAYDWEAATWLFTAIGDAYWSIRDYERAYHALGSALRSPGGIGNPFVHLRMGQVQYERGNREQAVDELLRAYMGAGEDIFDGQGRHYFQAIAGLI